MKGISQLPPGVAQQQQHEGRLAWLTCVLWLDFRFAGPLNKSWAWVHDIDFHIEIQIEYSVLSAHLGSAESKK